jgi:hypothetical protein
MGVGLGTDTGLCLQRLSAPILASIAQNIRADHEARSLIDQIMQYHLPWSPHEKQNAQSR